jgi:hypothetical protein
MTRHWGLTLVVCLAGCGFSSVEQRNIDTALNAGVKATQRNEFSEILSAVFAHDSPATPIIARYAEDGLFRSDQVQPWRPWGMMFSSATASTAPGSATTGLNVWKLDRRVPAVANTLVHERAHSFGFLHRCGETRAANLCDVAYVAGDLAEALSSHSCPGEPVCPALAAELQKRGLVKDCPQAREACCDP